MAEVISVSALNRYVKNLLDVNDVLFDLALRGEIANFVQNARSGHCYFSLRDEAASVRAVMFRSDARRLGFQPEEGMKVVVRCRVTLYERDGAFQVYVNDMFPDGIGSTQLAFEQLKAKLDKEGLFSPEHKKPLPRFHQCIGPCYQQDRCCTAGYSQCHRSALARSTSAAGSCECAQALKRQRRSRCHCPAEQKRADEISLWRAAAEAGRIQGIQRRGHCPCALPLQNAPSSAPLVTRSILRSRFVADQRAPTLSGGRACCARPCRTRTEIMHFGRKYSQLYPI